MYARMFPIESGPTQDLRSTLTAQQKGIDNMNWQLEQKTKQVSKGFENAQAVNRLLLLCHCYCNHYQEDLHTQ